MELKDLEITAYRFRRTFRFRREKMQDQERMKRIVAYLTIRIMQRCEEVACGNPRIQFFEQDRDNMVKNLVTLAITVDILTISE